ncbi:hypothetical protein IEO21_10506 [Rhodonia placenta]|uniref:Uncharacterized protein n=1 Tax=Rhodonia placenta TaxID=104341 RepID=A0A8H7TXH0_9APHY|nr:hypothetical protein IEO21_10506 [Postia placenta]
MGAKAGAIIAPRQRPSCGWRRQNRRVSRATCECQCECQCQCARKERRVARTTTRVDTRAAGQKTEPGVTALVPPTSSAPSLHTCCDVTSPIEGASRGRPPRRGGSLVASSPGTPCRAQRMHPAGHHDVAAHTATAARRAFILLNRSRHPSTLVGSAANGRPCSHPARSHPSTIANASMHRRSFNGAPRSHHPALL